MNPHSSILSPAIPPAQPAADLLARLSPHGGPGWLAPNDSAVHFGGEVTSLFRATQFVSLGATKGPDHERQTVYDGR